MAITGQECVNQALEMLGQLSPGETPSASDSASVLKRLNSVLDSASIQDEMAVAAVSATVSVSAGTASYALATRLAKLVSASYVIPSASTSEIWPLEVIDAKQFNSIEDKAALSVKPTKIFYDRAFPNASIHLVWVPNATASVSVLGWGALTQFASLATSVTFYPGYERWIVTELAMEVASLFPACRISDSLRLANTEAKNEIRKLNVSLWGGQPSQEGALTPG